MQISKLKKTNKVYFILSSVLFYFLLFTVHCSLFTVYALAREISSQRGCAICHIEWLTEFRRAEVTPLVEIPQTPIMIEGRQGVVSTERICFTCHDGYVNDSRFAFDKEKHRHPVYVKPSEKVKIPVTKEGKKVFPLNIKGEVYCGTCHSAHGRSWDDMGDPTKTLFLREPTENSAICLACHIEKAMGPAEGMHPFFKVGKIAKLPTEELKELGARVGTDAVQVICQSCHRMKGAPEKKLLIVRNDSSQLCGICHSDRYAENREEAARMGTHPVNVASDKIDINKKAEEIGGRTGTDGKIICQTCHKPHYAAKGRSILVKSNIESSLCKTCHEDKKTVDITKHNIGKMSPEEKNIREQTVSDKGTCSACHVPHSGKGPKMWARNLGDGKDLIERECLSCHSENSIAKKKTIGRYSHPVGRNIKKIGVSIDFPLFTEHGVPTNKKDDGNVVCATCHNVHQWDPADPAKEGAKDEEGGPSNSFLRKAAGKNSALCMECHKDKIYITDTDHDMMVTAKESKNIKSESPSESGICGTCHLPHNGNGPRMWARKDIGADADKVSGLCISCHSNNGIAKDKQVGKFTHPINVPITNIDIIPKRDGWLSKYLNILKASLSQTIKPLPLFDENGDRAQDGNMACPTCHDPHKWNPTKNEKGAGKNIEGDGKTSFLRIQMSPDSELCRNCHVDKRPVALSKHNLAVSAPDDKTPQDGRAAKESGVCNSCHMPHNALGWRLWARKLSGDSDMAVQLCTNCHSEKGPAKNKIIGKPSHPIAVNINKKIMPDNMLPLYANNGLRDKESGKIVCLTCHDPHQWDPDDINTENGAKKDVEGDATNSFLRLAAGDDPILCANCHQDKKYVLNTEHDMRVTASNAKNIKGEGVLQSGLCGQCHFVHNSQEPLLWAREFGPGQDTMEKLCRSCHSDGRAAGNKQPIKFSHPMDVVIVSPETRPTEKKKGGYFPLYTEDGKKSDAGYITCPTCHNPHKWSAAKQDYGPGKNTEGSAVNSFLRNKSESALCTECHGIDGLFRYKFFHGDTSRKPYPLSGQ
ncbi:MAG: cytochrome c3 family protein [Deltaproteobacteria bacterium]|nr:cytochrome c3 family protein [Deltaproteobacteria bacterium]